MALTRSLPELFLLIPLSLLLTSDAVRAKGFHRAQTFEANTVSKLAQASYRDRGFVLPSKNIYCLVEAPEPEITYLRCEIVSGLNPMPPRPTQDPCELDWGFGLVLPQTGKAQPLCAGDTIRADYPTLNYGKTWKREGFTCQASSSGLTCTNTSGNKMFLSRKRWSVY